MVFTKRIAPRLVLAFVAMAVIAGIWVASSPPAEAIIIGGPSICVYYSNPSHNHVVGARGTGCCGEPINWGQTSPYVSCQRLYCLDVICPF